MALELITPSTVSVVTLAEAKSHCRVDHADDDALINIYIKSAVSYLEGYRGMAGVSLGLATWVQYHDAFPCGPLNLLQRPVSVVEKVEYLDPTTGVYVEWLPSNFEVDTKSFKSRVTPKDSWPSVKDAMNAVKVTFKAGHVETSEIPEDLRLAVLLLVSGWYENRETINVGNIVNELPFAVHALINRHRELVV